MRRERGARHANRIRYWHSPSVMLSKCQPLCSVTLWDGRLSSAQVASASWIPFSRALCTNSASFVCRSPFCARTRSISAPCGAGPPRPARRCLGVPVAGNQAAVRPFVRNFRQGVARGDSGVKMRPQKKGTDAPPPNNYPTSGGPWSSSGSPLSSGPGPSRAPGLDPEGSEGPHGKSRGGLSARFRFPGGRAGISNG